MQQLPHQQSPAPHQHYPPVHLQHQALYLSPQLLSEGSNDSVQSTFEEAFQAALMGGGRAPMDTEMADGNSNNTALDREAVAAAAAVDRVKVASMLDQLALQQPLFMSSKYVKMADLNR